MIPRVTRPTMGEAGRMREEDEDRWCDTTIYAEQLSAAQHTRRHMFQFISVSSSTCNISSIGQIHPLIPFEDRLQRSAAIASLIKVVAMSVVGASLDPRPRAE